MNRARRALFLLPAPILALVIVGPASWAGQGRGPLATSAARSDRRAIVLIEDRVSFEELMAVPQFRALARAGGAALMTTKTGAGDRTRSSYLTIENGALTPANSPLRTLTSTLRSAGLTTCLDRESPLPLVEHDPRSVLATQECVGTRPCPQIGICPSFPAPGLTVAADSDTLRADEEARSGRPVDARSERADALRFDGRALSEILQGDQFPTLVMVVSPSTSLDMDRVGDQVTPLVMAEGRGDRLLSARGPMHALTSQTTRTDGVVANVDVAPTILRWFGVPVPSSMDGDPMTFTDAPAPFALHRLHLEQRRTRLPVALGEVAFIAAAGIVAIVALLVIGLRGGISPVTARAMRFLTVAASAFLLVILGGGLLPHMTYGWIVPYMGLATGGLAALALAVPWPGRFAPFAFLGAVGLAFVVLDALFGGNAFRVPLYGNTIFDGARFYGISNTFITLVLASALFLAHGLGRRAGVAVLFAAGLFMGFPRLGINIGGGITLFAAAGIWWAITAGRRATARPVVWGAVVTAVVTVAGLAIVLVANRYLPGAATHATRFVQRATGNAGYDWHTLSRRLSVGFSQFGHVPAAYIPIVGLPIVLALVLWGPAPIGRSLERTPRWRDATITLILAAVVAYFANDTGVAAAAPAFLYAVAMVAYPVFEDQVRASRPSLSDAHRPLEPVR